jgi:hypothetical protein
MLIDFKTLCLTLINFGAEGMSDCSPKPGVFCSFWFAIVHFTFQSLSALLLVLSRAGYLSHHDIATFSVPFIWFLIWCGVRVCVRAEHCRIRILTPYFFCLSLHGPRTLASHFASSDVISWSSDPVLGCKFGSAGIPYQINSWRQQFLRLIHSAILLKAVSLVIETRSSAVDSAVGAQSFVKNW